MILVEVRCNARGCRRLLATVEGFAPHLPGDPAALCVSKHHGCRTEAVVPAAFSGDVEIAVCPRHFKRVDGERMEIGAVTYRKIQSLAKTHGVSSISSAETGFLPCHLLEEPINRARLTGKTQVLPVA